MRQPDRTTETDRGSRGGVEDAAPIRPEVMATRRRSGRRWIFAGIVILLIVLLHRPLFFGLARITIVDQPATQGDYLWIPAGGGLPMSDGRYYDNVASLVGRSRERRVLLVTPPPNRLVEMGVVAPFMAETLRQLDARGIGEESVTVVLRKNDDARPETSLLQEWLEAQPGTRVTVLCDQFGTRHARLKLDRRLQPAEATRVSVVALRDPRFDDRDWWQSRAGTRHLLFAWIRLLYALAHDDQSPLRNSLSLEEYQRRFLATIGEESP
jgi:hypothetical protein